MGTRKGPRQTTACGAQEPCSTFIMCHGAERPGRQRRISTTRKPPPQCGTSLWGHTKVLSLTAARGRARGGPPSVPQSWTQGVEVLPGYLPVLEGLHWVSRQAAPTSQTLPDRVCCERRSVKMNQLGVVQLVCACHGSEPPSEPFRSHPLGRHEDQSPAPFDERFSRAKGHRGSGPPLPGKGHGLQG